jgi:hypothetical protein
MALYHYLKNQATRTNGISTREREREREREYHGTGLQAFRCDHKTESILEHK